MGRFRWGPGPSPSPLLLDRRRIYVLPTREGLLLGVLLWLMLLGSINYGVSLGLLFTFLLAGAALVSILHTFGNLNRLRVRAGRTEAVFAGDTAVFAMILENSFARPRWSVRVRPHGGTGASVDVPAEGVAVRIPRLAERRGRCPLGRITLETRFPLGLFRAWSTVEFSEARCLVYPRPVDPPSAWWAPTDTGRGGEGVEFWGLRAYSPGDPPGRIHWKASARVDALQVKEYGEESGILWLSWEQTEGVDPETRLSILCRLALDAEASGRPWGLNLPGFRAGPDRGEFHLHRCLEALALWEQAA